MGDPRATEGLIHLLEEYDGTEGHSEARAAAEALERFGDTKWKYLFEVKSGDLAILVAWGDPRSSCRWSKCSRINTTTSARTSAEALGHSRNPRAVDVLINALFGDNDVAEAAAKALARLGEPKWKALIKRDSEDFARLAGRTIAVYSSPSSRCSTAGTVIVASTPRGR